MKNKICIIGMAGIYPKCKNTDELWTALLTSKELSEQDENKTASSKFVSTYYKVEDTELFDNELFGYTPHECEVMDPQQRILLECAYRVMENTGYINGEGQNVIGTFMSASMSSYMLNNIYKNSQYNAEDLNYNVLIGNDKDFLATRISYKMNLSGPAFTVQCACSSSLNSLSSAMKSIQAGECNMALAGGVSLQFPSGTGYEYKEGGIMSKTGVCRPFDEKADGTVKGNGCSVIMIKRLEDAIRDRDPILAVIDGIAVNNDGSKKIGFTAPSIEGQKAVIQHAIKNANLTEDAVDYIETHGTGTPLGDPIEVRAISEAYANRQRTDKICLGSIKANVGHMDAAAGITSVIKGIYILNHNVIPAIKNFSKQNPALDNFSKNLCYPTENIEKNVQTIGVSSFGLGGTNVHVILSKYNQQELNAHKLGTYAVPVSYLREDDFAEYKEEMYRLINSVDTLEDAVYSICVSQKRFVHNQSILCSSKEELMEHLKQDNYVNEVLEKTLAVPSFTLTEYQKLEQLLVSFSEHCNVLKATLNKSLLEQADYDKALAGYIKHLGISSSRKCKIIVAGSTPSIISKEAEPVTRLMHFIASANVYCPVSWKLLYGSQNFQLKKALHYPMKKSKFFVVPDNMKLSAKTGNGTKKISLQSILSLWRNTLGVETITDTDDFFDLGGDSMIAIDIVDKLARDYSVQISMKDFMNHCTPKSLFELVSRNNVMDTCISKVKEGNPDYKLFLVHAAGGGTFEYKELCRLLKSHFTVYAIDLPEDYGNYNSFQILSKKYLNEIKAIQSTGKYYIGGHSFGGNLALEMSLQLQAEGRQAELVLFDSHIPDAYTDRVGGTIDYNQIFQVITDTYVEKNNRERILKDKLNGQDAQQFYAKWIYNHRLLKEYKTNLKLNGNIIFYQATERENPEILKGLHINELDKNQWAGYCTGKFVKYDVSGNHYTMFSNSAHREDLAKKLDRYLCQIEEASQ